MDRFKITKRIALLGIAANILLLVLKINVGVMSKSQAMMADGFNSAGDVFASAMTYTGNKISERPEDQTHPYGHGKAEYIFSMIISFSLLIVAYRVFRSSLGAILRRETFLFSWWLVATAVFTITIKLILFIYARTAGQRNDSLLILANSEDHRNDVFVTSSTLLGIILGVFGIFWIDGVVGIGISLWIAYTGFKIFWSSYHVLMDRNVDNRKKDEILAVISQVEGIDHVDDVIAKPIGVNYIIIVKVSVPGDMSVNKSHSIAAQIKEKLKGIKKVSDVVVHVNPA